MNTDQVHLAASLETARAYPYVAWTLLPSFKPKQVTMVSAYRSFSYQDTWDVSDSGRSYAMSDLFPTKQAAIDAGWERVHAMEARISKTLDAVGKKRTALVKAMGEQS